MPVGRDKMSTIKSRQGYAIGKPLVSLAPDVITSERDPNVGDRAEAGSLWVKKTADHQAVYVNNGILSGDTLWSPLYYKIVQGTIASPATTITLNGLKGSAVLTGFTTAANTGFALTINNSKAVANAPIQITASVESGGGARLSVKRVGVAAGVITVFLYNDSALNPVGTDITVTFELF